jgi:hypothetical protein
MSDEHLALQDLFDRGWVLDPHKGVDLPNFASVSLCLMREGHKSVCIPGYGTTRLNAVEDAVQEANAWIVRQRDEDTESRKSRGVRRRTSLSLGNRIPDPVSSE